MTSKLKCPFCQQELIREGMNHWWCSCNINHQGKELYGTTALWQALIQSQKDLEESQQATLENAQTVLEIHKDLEIATKALESIRDDLFCQRKITARQALEQIEHKE